MNTQELSFPLDRIALALSLIGVVFGVIIAIVGRMIGQELAMHGYGVFVAFSVSAIVLGFLTRASAVGKTALFTSSILLVFSLGIVG